MVSMGFFACLFVVLIVLFCLFVCLFVCLFFVLVFVVVVPNMTLTASFSILSRFSKLDCDRFVRPRP